MKRRLRSLEAYMRADAMKLLTEKLTAYDKTHLPMHMPGHKRRSDMLASSLPYNMDITEVDGFDNLHDMQGVLKETADLAARLYGSIAAFPLVGGSTCGILAAMHALCPANSHVLLCRGSHKSVFHGVDLLGLVPHYLTAEADTHGVMGKIDSADVEKALIAHPEISLVVITSPTYEGVVQDICAIQSICHRFGATLLVDSAHGAHCGFSEHFPQSAVVQGADVVVMSLHKTMPCLTQTALLHVCSSKVDINKISESLSVFETSSPSYILLASIDECLHRTEKQGENLCSKLHQNLSAFYEKTVDLKNLSILHYDDESKVIISTKNADISGVALANQLRQTSSIEVEMACADYALAMTSICDDETSLNALADALIAIDAQIAPSEKASAVYVTPLPEMRCIPADAHKKSGTFLPLSAAVGKTVLEYIWAYPPGIPLIVPGEIFSQEMLALFQSLAQSGVELKSTKGKIKENTIFAEV